MSCGPPHFKQRKPQPCTSTIDPGGPNLDPILQRWPDALVPGTLGFETLPDHVMHLISHVMGAPHLNLNLYPNPTL